MKKKDMEEEFKNFIDPVFSLGDMVFLKADTLQYPRIVIAFHISKGLYVRYELRGVEDVGVYEDFEISKEKDISLLIDHEDD